MKLPVFGYKIENFAYLTDFNHIDDCELEKLMNLDLLIIDALRIEKHISHLSLNEALELIRKISPKKAILTHMSHHMGLHDDICATLPKNVTLAYDGLQIKL